MANLNRQQKSHIQATFVEIDHRLIEFEGMLARDDTGFSLSATANDLSPVQSRVVREYFARIRNAMKELAVQLEVPTPSRRTSLTWRLITTLVSLRVDLEEMSASSLRGYGPIDDHSATEVRRAQQELFRLLDRLDSFLRAGTAENLEARIEQLGELAIDKHALKIVDEIITKWNLVDARPLLTAIVERLEHPVFEVAFFGRVSSGKSTLLNRIMGADLLPVGVTPVTSVPTRLTSGSQPRAIIRFAEAGARTVSVAELAEYVSEAKNPGNSKHVIDALVEYPSPHLKAGVILTDTPGFGSLARSGSAETHAYLPRCDHGVLLIDAASIIDDQDLEFVQLLRNAGIGVTVLLSKADLPSTDDLDRLTRYTQNQLQTRFETTLAVHPVSALASRRDLLEQWIAEDLEPMLARHQTLVQASVARKLESLRRQIKAMLRGSLGRREPERPSDATRQARLREAVERGDRAISTVTQKIQEWQADLVAIGEAVIQQAAVRLTGGKDSSAAREGPLLANLTKQRLEELQQTALALMGNLRRELVASVRMTQDVEGDGEDHEEEAPPARNLPWMDDAALARRLPTPRSMVFLIARLAGRWLAERWLESHYGDTIRDVVQTHDRHLRRWLKHSLDELIEWYDRVIGPSREQIARAAGDATATDSEQAEVERDLRRLEEMDATAKVD